MLLFRKHPWLFLATLLVISACGAQGDNQPPADVTEQQVDPPTEESLPPEEENPLLGTWIEVAQISCQSESERTVPNPIKELVFFEDNTINVTWFPFESYVDYIGTYAIDEEGGIEIVAEELNYLPPELDTSGSYEIDERGRLLLMDMWLGVPPLDSPHPVNCGHIFEQR